MAEPVRCICGQRPKLSVDGPSPIGWCVRCSRHGCWVGPIRKTDWGAVKAWDQVMTAAIKVRLLES